MSVPIGNARGGICQRSIPVNPFTTFFSLFPRLYFFNFFTFIHFFFLKHARDGDTGTGTDMVPFRYGGSLSA